MRKLRRRFLGLNMLVMVMLAVMLPLGLTNAQTPSASPASDLFAMVVLEPGTVPTFFGDVSIPENPERIITLTDGALDGALAIGIEPVGATASSNGTSAAAYLSDQVPDTTEYVGGWGELDVEKIVGLQPDLILADRYLLDEEYATLSAIAPVVAPQEITVADAYALQQWELELLIWGHAVGRDEAAQSAILDLRARATDIQAELGGHLGDSVVVFRPQPNFPVIMSHAWITGTILTWAGLTGNELTESLPPPHSGDTISLERLDLLDADWLFAAARDQEQRDELAVYIENPLIQMLDVSTTGQIALVPGDLWSGATGVLAGHAMLDDIERIVIGGER